MRAPAASQCKPGRSGSGVHLMQLNFARAFGTSGGRVVEKPLRVQATHTAAATPICCRCELFARSERRRAAAQGSGRSSCGERERERELTGSQAAARRRILSDPATTRGSRAAWRRRRQDSSSRGSGGADRPRRRPLFVAGGAAALSFGSALMPRRSCARERETHCERAPPTR